MGKQCGPKLVAGYLSGAFLLGLDLGHYRSFPSLDFFRRELGIHKHFREQGQAGVEILSQHRERYGGQISRTPDSETGANEVQLFVDLQGGPTAGPGSQHPYREVGDPFILRTGLDHQVQCNDRDGSLFGCQQDQTVIENDPLDQMGRHRGTGSARCDHQED